MLIFPSGASSGIGEATAVEFARHGCCLALNGRNVENLKRTATLSQQAGLPVSKVSVVYLKGKDEFCFIRSFAGLGFPCGRFEQHAVIYAHCRLTAGRPGSALTTLRL